MKRNMGVRKKGRIQVLSDSSNAIENASSANNSSGDEEDHVKRNRLVERRRSFIQMDKNKNAENQGHSGAKRNGNDTVVSSDLDDTDDSNAENVARAKRIRRRLSKRLDEIHNQSRLSNVSALNLSYGNLNVGSEESPRTNNSPRNKQPTDKRTLQEIYSTCSALFQAHKITPQNAFSLKLVECLDEIIESDEFDRRNLPLLARTLEIGGKIYICRVDHTHTHTIKLATEIAQNETTAGQKKNNDGEGGQENQTFDDAQGGEDGGDAKKKARANRKKRSRFIEDNEAKLNTGFEDQSSKYATRRNSLKLKLHRNIDEELDFDYLSYFQKPGEASPVERDEEYTALASEASIPESHFNMDEMKNIPWLAFNALTEWDAAKFDLWGVPLSTSDAADVSALQRPSIGAPVADVDNENEFAYNPENRPDDYPVVEEGGNSFGGPPGDGFDDDNDFNEDGRPAVQPGAQPLAVENLRSLDDLRKFFASLKGDQLVMKKKYGWSGPVFLKPQRTVMPRLDGKKTKKEPKRKKKELIIDFEDIDWKKEEYRFTCVASNKIRVDDKTLEKWASTKTMTPYCNPLNFMDYDEDEEEFRRPFGMSESQEDLMGNVTRFFVDSNRNIFQLMEEEFRQGKDVLSQSHFGPGGGGPGFRDDDDGYPEPELDIEAPRDFADDSGEDALATPEDDMGLPGLAVDDFAAAGFNLSAMFPGSIGFDTNGMSKASEFDSMKFAKQPKPIDMHALKRVIRQILTEKLELEEDGRPTLDEETRIDLISLITEVMKRVNSRMAKHLSVAICVVGLMHVVADNKLFMISGTDDSSGSPLIVCRGKLWKHKDNIPFGRQDVDDDDNKEDQ